MLIFSRCWQKTSINIQITYSERAASEHLAFVWEECCVTVPGTDLNYVFCDVDAAWHHTLVLIRRQSTQRSLIIAAKRIDLHQTYASVMATRLSRQDVHNRNCLNQPSIYQELFPLFFIMDRFFCVLGKFKYLQLYIVIVSRSLI